MIFFYLLFAVTNFYKSRGTPVKLVGPSKCYRTFTTAWLCKSKIRYLSYSDDAHPNVITNPLSKRYGCSGILSCDNCATFLFTNMSYKTKINLQNILTACARAGIVIICDVCGCNNENKH